MVTARLVPDERQAEADRLADAGEQLGAVLETVDLRRDRELAEALLAAIRATDRAKRLANDRPSVG